MEMGEPLVGVRLRGTSSRERLRPWTSDSSEVLTNGLVSGNFTSGVRMVDRERGRGGARKEPSGALAELVSSGPTGVTGVKGELGSVMPPGRLRERVLEGADLGRVMVTSLEEVRANVSVLGPAGSKLIGGTVSSERTGALGGPESLALLEMLSRPKLRPPDDLGEGSLLMLTSVVLLNESLLPDRESSNLRLTISSLRLVDEGDTCRTFESLSFCSSTASAPCSSIASPSNFSDVPSRFRTIIRKDASAWPRGRTSGSILGVSFVRPEEISAGLDPPPCLISFVECSPGLECVLSEPDP